jgi:hypothetical protein
MPPFDSTAVISAVELSQIMSFFVGSITGIAFVIAASGRNF